MMNRLSLCKQDIQTFCPSDINNLNWSLFAFYIVKYLRSKECSQHLLNSFFFLLKLCILLYVTWIWLEVNFFFILLLTCNNYDCYWQFLVTFFIKWLVLMSVHRSVGFIFTQIRSAARFAAGQNVAAVWTYERDEGDVPDFATQVRAGAGVRVRWGEVRWGEVKGGAGSEVRCGEVRWGGVQAVRALFFSFTFSARLLQCGNQTEVIFFKGKPILFSKRLFFLQYTNFLFFGYGSEGNWDEEKTVKMKKNYVHQSHYSVRYFWSDFIWIYLPKYSN